MDLVWKKESGSSSSCLARLHRFLRNATWTVTVQRKISVPYIACDKPACDQSGGVIVQSATLVVEDIEYHEQKSLG